MRNPFKSIRWRLQAWHGLILLLVAVGFCAPAYRLATDNQLQRIDKEMGRTERILVRALMDAVRPPPPPGSNSQPGERTPMAFSEFLKRLRTEPVVLPANVEVLFQGREPGHSYFSIRDAEDKVLLQSPNAPDDLNLLPVPTGDLVEEYRTVDHRRELCRSSSQGWRILLGRDITPDQEGLNRLGISVLVTVLGVWALGLLGGWWLAGRAIRPIESISHAATRIAEGNLEQRINISDTDSELGELSRLLNQTFERLHDAFERQRQFTADASHELRTPLTILLTETQRILKRERTNEEYREAVQTCGDTARRMSRLIESLLLLARQDMGGKAMQREACDLMHLTKDVWQNLVPLAAERSIEVRDNLSPAPCQGDAAALSVLITNLVANAIQHHQHGGRVSLESGIRDGRSWLAVRDDGPGIAESDLPHLFERFYRADKARTGSSGHSGLGLSIAKAIADNHGAEIRVTSTVGKGSRFELRM